MKYSFKAYCEGRLGRILGTTAGVGAGAFGAGYLTSPLVQSLGSPASSAALPGELAGALGSAAPLFRGKSLASLGGDIGDVTGDWLWKKTKQAFAALRGRGSWRDFFGKKEPEQDYTLGGQVTEPEKETPVPKATERYLEVRKAYSLLRAILSNYGYPDQQISNLIGGGSTEANRWVNIFFLNYYPKIRNIASSGNNVATNQEIRQAIDMMRQPPVRLPPPEERPVKPEPSEPAKPTKSSFADRVKTAREMFKNGRTAEEIAKQMGLTVKTIKRYLRSGDRPRLRIAAGTSEPGFRTVRHS